MIWNNNLSFHRIVKLLHVVMITSLVKSLFLKFNSNRCSTRLFNVKIKSLLDNNDKDAIRASWTTICESEYDLETLGWNIATKLGIGDVILLTGDLGSGKTTFSRGLIRSKYNDEEMIVTSPSYLLDNKYDYDENRSIHHIDLYRLPMGCDLSILGIPSIFNTSICLIEWPQRMAKSLPDDFLEVDISISQNEYRMVNLRANSERWIDKLVPILGPVDSN